MRRRLLSSSFPKTLIPCSTFCSQPFTAGGATTDCDGSVLFRRVQPAGEDGDSSRDGSVHRNIVRIMLRRPWTTRLENTLRTLCPSPTEALVTAVLQGAADADRPDLSLRFFRFAERRVGFRHTPATYAAIVPILAGRQMLNHARCLLLESMPANGLTPDEPSLAALIAGYGRASIPQEVVKLFRNMPELGIPRTTLSYNALLKAILVNGREGMARRVYNAMLRDGINPNRQTYHILIWGMGLCRKVDSLNRFVADMKERSIAPDILTYNFYLNGLARTSRWDDAEKVLEEMAVAGIALNAISYNILIKGYVSAGRVSDALKMFDEMHEKGVEPSRRTFMALMPGLCDDTTRSIEARKVVEEMVKRKLTPKDKTVFLRLVTTLCRAGDLDGAVEVHRHVGQLENVSIDTAQYGVLIETLCGGHKYEGAIQVLDELLEKGTLLSTKSSALEPSAYNPIIKHLCSNGNANKAEAFFRQLMRKGVADKVAFDAIITGHAKEGNPDAAQEMLAIMIRRKAPTDAKTHVTLVECFLNKGESADARTALDRMLEQGHLPSALLFRSVITTLFDDGRVQTASRVMRTMIEKGVTENLDVVHKILEALFMRGHVEEAIGRIELMMSHGCRPDLDKILVLLCENERAMEAQRLTDFALDRDYDVSFENYDRVLNALYAQGKSMPAYSILCKIKQKGGVVDKKGCDNLIASLRAEGNMKQADILSRMFAENAKLASRKGRSAAATAGL